MLICKEKEEKDFKTFAIFIFSVWIAAIACFLFFQNILPNIIGSILLFLFKADLLKAIFSSGFMQFVLKSTIWSLYWAAFITTMNFIFSSVFYANINLLLIQSELKLIFSAALKTALRMLPFQAVITLLLLLIAWLINDFRWLMLAPFSTNIVPVLIFSFWLSGVFAFSMADSYQNDIKKAFFGALILFRRHYTLFTIYFFLLIVFNYALALLFVSGHIAQDNLTSLFLYKMTALSFLLYILLSSIFVYFIIPKNPFQHLDPSIEDLSQK